MLTREQILAKRKATVVKIVIDEWVTEGQDGVVFVRGMTSKEREHWESAGFSISRTAKGKVSVENKTENDARARAVILGLCNEQGERQLSDDDIDAVNDMSAGPIAKISDAILSLSGITKESLEDILGN